MILMIYLNDEQYVELDMIILKILVRIYEQLVNIRDKE